LTHSLVTEYKRTFLSRPRRFGKSLLVSTLEAILQEKKELFEGIWIANSDLRSFLDILLPILAKNIPLNP
jgi:hypothetical protein